jgi:hypothetical protein
MLPFTLKRLKIILIYDQDIVLVQQSVVYLTQLIILERTGDVLGPFRPN